MDKVLKPGCRTGKIKSIPSKSQAHRQLICTALYGGGSVVLSECISEDIKATIDCLKAAGADVYINGDEIKLDLIEPADGHADFFCKESGSTLRFMLPVAGALGIEGTFHLEGRLSERPMVEFVKQLEEHGMKIQQEGVKLHFSGRLNPGKYILPGNISSQYISGLLMALPLLKGTSSIEVAGKKESENYILMTEDVLKASGVVIKKEDNIYYIEEKNEKSYLGKVITEGDWSNATFFLCMGALSEKGITVTGLSSDSSQGDKEIINILKKIGAEIEINEDEIFVKKGRLMGCEIDASGIPDMIPAISAVTAVCEGKTIIKNAARLRMKESDRLKSIHDMLDAVSANVVEKEDGLVIEGAKQLSGGEISSFNDHRIAMSAAVCACVASDEIIIKDAGCVAKSYPDFWDMFEGLEISN